MKTLVVVPTSGNRQISDKVVPGVGCQRRLARAARHLQEDIGSVLAIVGGWRPDAQQSEAAVASKWFKGSFPELADRLGLCQADANCTAEDMVRLAGLLHTPEWTGTFVLIVSHPDHARMAMQTLRACGIGIDKVDFLDSGEERPYGLLKLLVLNLVYRVDPTWQSPLAKLLARFVSSKRRNGV